MNRLQINELITCLSHFYKRTNSELSLFDSVRVCADREQVALKMNQDDNRSHFSYLLECTAACLHSTTREYIKASSLIYMRHGLLATDAGVILPTHNYTHQQHLFCMDDSQLQIHIFPLCLCSDTETTNSAQIPSSSFWHRNSLSD